MEALTTTLLTTPTPVCPLATCDAPAGASYCLTPTGFRRPLHDVRVAAMQATAAGTPAPAVEQPPAGRLAHRRPSEKQVKILAVAADDGGLYELSGYGFHGEAQRRAAVLAMVDDSRGWMRHVRETQHGTLYEITNEGRSALARYRDWMNGVTS